MKLSHKITLCVLYQLSLWSNLTAQIDLNDPKVKEAARTMGVSKNQIKLLEPMIDESVDSKNIIDNSEFNESFEGVSQSSDNSQNLKDIEESYELDKSNNDISGTSDNKSNDAENNINDLNTSNVFIITTPTPILKNKKPDLSLVFKAFDICVSIFLDSNMWRVFL